MKEYDPDHFMFIDAPRKGRMSLVVMPLEIDAERMVEVNSARFDFPLVKIHKRTPFDTWGSLEGHGVTLSGEKNGHPFLVRYFGYTDETQGMFVTEFWWDGPASINKEGFELIADSFQFKSMPEISKSDR
ncbi:hypothetical protein [Rubinisphaera margarita]|uniref:hypothetical protein n=1 Tax=Rubinisphaera margarita TaxID=2909586 RepID=UPI001EE7F35B|nr:hypothetical protein [Rubinisphaera margarita]MCG6157917.1 hypothetical protein [Rubinisphaera margarita]